LEKLARIEMVLNIFQPHILQKKEGSFFAEMNYIQRARGVGVKIVHANLTVHTAFVKGCKKKHMQS
jgi:hypothetical protein